MPEIKLARTGNNQLAPVDDDAMNEVLRHEPGVVFSVKIKATDTGSLSMLNTWRGWMRETAQWMAWQGATMPLVVKTGKPYGSRPFNATDAHELFTHMLMGCDEEGRRYSWALGENDTDCVKAPKSKRLMAMERHQQWAAERGLMLRIPRGGEYDKLKQEHEGGA